MSINMENKDTILEMVESGLDVGVRSLSRDFSSFSPECQEDLNAVLEGISPEEGKYEVSIPEDDDDINTNIENVFHVEEELEAVFYRPVIECNSLAEPVYAVDFVERLNEMMREFDKYNYKSQVFYYNLDDADDDYGSDYSE